MVIFHSYISLPEGIYVQIMPVPKTDLGNLLPCWGWSWQIGQGWFSIPAKGVEHILDISRAYCWVNYSSPEPCSPQLWNHGEFEGNHTLLLAARFRWVNLLVVYLVWSGENRKIKLESCFHTFRHLCLGVWQKKAEFSISTNSSRPGTRLW